MPVRRIRSPAMHGDDRPEGVSVFQRRFVSALNWMGGFSFSATPEEFGPRNCGQELPAKRLRLAARIVRESSVIMADARGFECNQPVLASTILFEPVE